MNKTNPSTASSKRSIKHMIPILAISMIAFLGNCVSTQINEELYRTYLTRDFNYSKDRLMQATIAALNAQKIAIEKIDMKKGTIVTERYSFFKMTTIAGNEYYATAQSNVATHQYYLLITGDKNRSMIQATRYRLWNNSIEQTVMNAGWAKTNVWDPFFKEIQDALEE